MVCVLEREAEDDEACDHKRCREVDYAEADFRLENAIVAADIISRVEIVQPDPSDFTEDCSCDGSEVEESWDGSGISTHTNTLRFDNLQKKRTDRSV